MKVLEKNRQACYVATLNCFKVVRIVHLTQIIKSGQSYNLRYN